jgi:hypothetical protein
MPDPAKDAKPPPPLNAELVVLMGTVVAEVFGAKADCPNALCPNPPAAGAGRPSVLCPNPPVAVDFPKPDCPNVDTGCAEVGVWESGGPNPGCPKVEVPPSLKTEMVGSGAVNGDA